MHQLQVRHLPYVSKSIDIVIYYRVLWFPDGILNVRVCKHCIPWMHGPSVSVCVRVCDDSLLEHNNLETLFFTWKEIYKLRNLIIV